MRRKKSRPFMDGGDRSNSQRRRSSSGPGSELFICFTSRPSSSSSSAAAAAAVAAMRAPCSKSLHSPGRGGAGPGTSTGSSTAAAPSLSASLSRRLHSSGSVKGAQSPMFPAAAVAVAAGGRRKSTAFEAAEPSSPKVTCIGQVRVKGKKKKKGMALRSRSQREASFRRDGAGRERGQGWVHQIPVSICEALRAFGSEFSCLLPCGGRSFCSSTSSAAKATNAEERKGREEKPRGMGSCGAAFARWLMAVEESEEGQGGKVVGVVVEERDEEMGFLMRERREKVMEGFEAQVEKKNDILVMGKEKEKEKEEEEAEGAEEEEEEEARVSVCVPPRNALLLMRCRSDPVRMAALANRFWGSPATKVQEEEEVEEEEEGGGEAEEEEEEEKSEEREELGGEGCVEVGVEEHDGGAEVVEADLVGMEVVKSSQEALFAVGAEKRNQVGEKIEEKQRHEEENQGGSEEEEEEDEEESAPKDCILDEAAKPHRNPHGEGDEKEEGEEEEEEERQKDGAESQNKAAVEMKLSAVEEEEKEGEELKFRRFSSCSSSTTREERRPGRCGVRRRGSSSSLREREREREKRRHSFSTERDARRPSFSNEQEARRSSFSVDRAGRRRWSFSVEGEGLKTEKALKELKKGDECSSDLEEAKAEVGNEDNMNTDETQAAGEEVRQEGEEHYEGKEEGGGEEQTEEKVEQEDEEDEQEEDEQEEGEKKWVLPECLLLMMYEPKLSMEVSKETWVCSTDFLSWRLPHYGQQSGGGGGGGGDGEPSKEDAVGKSKTKPKPKPKPKPKSKPKRVGGGDDHLKGGEDKGQQAKPAIAALQRRLPPPVAPTALAVEQKLKLGVPMVPFGPFVLTRCKSEPMRSSARLAPDACFWKERHRPIGAAGIGF